MNRGGTESARGAKRAGDELASLSPRERASIPRSNGGWPSNVLNIASPSTLGACVLACVLASVWLMAPAKPRQGPARRRRAGGTGHPRAEPANRNRL